MDFESARIKMVDNQIRTTDVTDTRILRAFLTVPREEFVPDTRRSLAYIDQDIPLGGTRYLMEPSPFAKLLQLAEIQETDSVLDVGCGTGYSSAILSHLARSVVALETASDLAKRAANLLSRHSFPNCTVVEGPLTEGHLSNGPYDVILLNGAVEQIPPGLFDQLHEGGRLVAVEGYGNAAVANLYLKEEAGVSYRFGFNCCVKPLPGFEVEQSFVF